ncbi:MAG: hypothetical protein J07HX64_00157 [halophilic archaeon J07HX64]|jgi:hypothetical protein|nr:MAG: hypothetical protein J07HX64_00157 [halophilic archaeon J07HX64]
MEEVGALTEALEGSLADLEPPPFRNRVTGAIGERPLLPGVLTIRVARRIDATADIQAAAARGAGVQMCYEGLELTRSVLRTEPWEDPDGMEAYHQDLLVAEVLVSQGFNLLAETGVVTDAVAIVQRFGRTQTALDDLGHRHDEEPLEVDVLELAVNAGADLSMDGVSSAVRAHSGDVARELLEYPLPDPDQIGVVDDQLDALAADVCVAGPNQ